VLLGGVAAKSLHWRGTDPEKAKRGLDRAACHSNLDKQRPEQVHPTCHRPPLFPRLIKKKAGVLVRLGRIRDGVGRGSVSTKQGH
jgi:hypothetical protein